jgi:preprotein translocase subunit SecD
MTGTRCLTLTLCGLMAGFAVPAGAAGGPGRGLWVGSIQICRGTALGAAAGSDDQGGTPSVTITLRPRWRTRLARATARLVGRSMPVRLDGRLLMEPIVREPITGGVLMLAGQAPGDAEAMRVAAAQAC